MHTHRRFLFTVTVVCAMGVLVANGREQQPRTPLRVGVINSMTGDFQAFGRWVRDGLQVAVDDINKRGGIQGRQVELVTEDDGSDPKRSVEAFRKLASQKVAAILGPISSDGTTATAPLATELKIVQISPIAPNKGTGAATANTFLIYPSTVEAAQAAVRTAVQRFKGSRIAFFHTEDRAIASVRTTATGLKANIVSAEKFTRGTKDFDGRLEKVRTAKPDVVIYPSYLEEESIALTRSARSSLRDTIIIIVGAACVELLRDDVLNDPAFQRNLYVVNEAFAPGIPNQPAMQSFIESFRTRYTETPTTYAGAAHASLTILADALGKAGTDAAAPALVRALRAGTFNTAFGQVRFNAAGTNAAARFEVFKIANKELRLAGAN